VKTHWIKFAILVLLAVFAWLPSISFSSFYFSMWLHDLFGNVYYRDFGYLPLGIFRLSLVLCGVGTVVYAMRKRPPLIWLAVVSLFIGYQYHRMGVLQPELHLKFNVWNVVQQESSEMRESFEYFGWTMHHFPASMTDLDEHPDVKESVLRKTLSPYSFKGKRLPYNVVFVPNAKGPFLDESHSGAPGTFYLAVRPDRKKAWLTTTILPVDHVIPDGTRFGLLIECSAKSIFLREDRNESSPPLVWTLSPQAPK
jgi:hypothetical protein